ncbi:Clr5 domain [Fusarium oxysporum f. sp. vasinfectum]|nr:Clr5 domain [Fusarium oxysporum f. sp. vasinfectum]
MPASSGSLEWDRWKDVIHALYILEDRPLKGPRGVIKCMEEQHDFRATKSQYEYRFKKWGFWKNLTHGNWQIISWKINKRKKDGKNSDVYCGEELISVKRLRKEISRHDMTTLEKLHWTQAPSPPMPPGFQIQTPPGQAVVGLAFEELPILQLERIVRAFANDFTSDPRGSYYLSSFLRHGLVADAKNPIPSVINSLLPISAFKNEMIAPGAANELNDPVGPAQLLLLILDAFLKQSSFFLE